MWPARGLGVIGVLLGLHPGCAAAERAIPEALYRPDTPAVLQPAEADLFRHRDEIVREFARAYGAQGRPRVALFWNRLYDDRVSEWTSGVRVTESERTRLNGSISGERSNGSGAAGSIAGSLGADLSRDRSMQAEWRAPQQARWSLDEALALELEAGFTALLTEAAVAVLDRAAIMRLQDRAQRSATADAQRLETDALLGRADLLIELVMAPHPSAPLGASFKVTVKEVRTGRIVTSRTGDGHAALQASGQRWEVGDDGFVRASGQRETAWLVGEELALDLMAALAERWR
jgi:hypothetical protein